MLCVPIANYLKEAQGLPFFYTVGDDEYNNALTELKQAGLTVIRVSNFCSKDDKVPDIDELIDYFRTADVDYRDNKFVVIGLGEYLALCGNDEIISTLNRLKSTTLGGARVILLLRGISSYVADLASCDKKLVGQGRVSLSKSLSNLSATNILYATDIVSKKGIKWLLRNYEDGCTGNCLFSSNRSLPNSIIPITTVSGAYSTLRYVIKDFVLPEVYGTDELWEALLTQVQKHSNSFAKVFDQYNVADNWEDDIYAKCNGMQFRNWLYFISLKLNVTHIQNDYLRWVTENTDNWQNLKSNLLLLITKLSHAERSFQKMYDLRKKLLRDFPEADIAIFVKENSIVPEEEIYRLTDNTDIEKKQVITWIAKYGWSDACSYVYPLLSAYMQKYVFDCGALSGELTTYFENYKKQKLLNRLDPNFLEQVEAWGQSHKYARIQSRDGVIQSVSERQSAYLYWIDAMGVEYLSLVTELAKKKGLSIHIEIARAELPTITSINKNFFDRWDGEGKFKEERLDDIKHSEKGGFFFTSCEFPIHLASEIAVIENAINVAATKLAMHECKSFVIASDHGASRLAVIKRQEEKYCTDTQGEHSGRCCKAFSGCELKNCVEEKGFLILTDYGRFQGSRVANVEVHGGATLEEVLVPIITLKLKKQGYVDIRVLNSDNIQADRKQGTTVRFYISDVDDPQNISIVIDESRYKAIPADVSHYSVLMPNIRRSKNCTANIYDGDSLLGSVELKIRSKSGGIDSSFDSEFEDF